MQTAEIDTPDDELLLTISCDKTDPKAAEDARLTFYRRYRRLMFAAATKFAKGTNLEAEELMLKTFLSAFENAGKFNCADTDPSVIQVKVKAWLYLILKNKIRDEIRRLANEIDMLKAYEEDELDSSRLRASHRLESEALPPSALTLKARKVLEDLSDRDRAILGLSLEYIDLKTGYCEIPKDELEALAKSLSVLPATIKTHRHRILERIRGSLA